MRGAGRDGRPREPRSCLVQRMGEESEKGQGKGECLDVKCWRFQRSELVVGPGASWHLGRGRFLFTPPTATPPPRDCKGGPYWL